MARSFGVEEEFILADAESLTPVNVAHDVIDHLLALRLPGTITTEFLDCQIEYATGICTTAEQAVDELSAFRLALQSWAEPRGLVVVPSGTPFLTGNPRLTPAIERYQLISDDVGILAGEHMVNGMHVHVGIDNAADRVRAVNIIRPWLPLLLGLSANSPFWQGTDTGFHSWRTVHQRRWTTNGIPPIYVDEHEHERMRKRMIGVGATRSYNTANWGVRVSENLPTVELRIGDVQLTAATAVSLALVVRALVDDGLRRADDESPEVHHVLDAELWHAGRYGIENGVYNPLTREHADASKPVAHLLQLLAEDYDGPVPAFVTDELATLAAGRDGATRQREALAGGVEGLSAFYRDRMHEGAA